MSYSQYDLKLAIDTIFERYDTDQKGELEHQEVLKLFNDCLRHMGYRFRLGLEEVMEYMGQFGMGESEKMNRTMFMEIFKGILK